MTFGADVTSSSPAATYNIMAPTATATPYHGGAATVSATIKSSGGGGGGGGGGGASTIIYKNSSNIDGDHGGGPNGTKVWSKNGIVSTVNMTATPVSMMGYDKHSMLKQTPPNQTATNVSPSPTPFGNLSNNKKRRGGNAESSGPSLSDDLILDDCVDPDVQRHMSLSTVEERASLAASSLLEDDEPLHLPMVCFQKYNPELHALLKGSHKAATTNEFDPAKIARVTKMHHNNTGAAGASFRKKKRKPNNTNAAAKDSSQQNRRSTPPATKNNNEPKNWRQPSLGQNTSMFRKATASASNGSSASAAANTKSTFAPRPNARQPSLGANQSLVMTRRNNDNNADYPVMEVTASSMERQDTTSASSVVSALTYAATSTYMVEDLSAPEAPHDGQEEKAELELYPGEGGGAAAAKFGYPAMGALDEEDGSDDEEYEEDGFDDDEFEFVEPLALQRPTTSVVAEQAEILRQIQKQKIEEAKARAEAERLAAEFREEDEKREKLEREKREKEDAAAAAAAAAAEDASSTAGGVGGQNQQQGDSTADAAASSLREHGEITSYFGGRNVKVLAREHVEEAWSRGDAVVVQCIGCEKSLMATGDMAMVYCPFCGTLAPAQLLSEGRMS